ncbi:hypothetical protein KFK09_022124 [Dendrobium nobile]|uniref:Uncharacterized protein n=1 Tax=Dendrobium nobile TaxID=94219 RepID=A0A8T3AIH5_DENNO|nr:hypothetical protein KFK09_022124 [Dendrobium nobile]
MEQFRKEFKERNPKNNQVSVVGKAGDPFVAKADKQKAEYQKKLKAYDAEEDTKKDVAYEESFDNSEVRDEDEGSEEEGDEEDNDD